MAANEYYHPQSQSPYHSRPDNTFSPSPYSSHSPYEPPPTEARPSPPPSYTSQPPPAAYQRYDGADRPNTSSPFETVFDDHVYPVDPRRQNSSSQHSLTHQDSQYHGTSAYSSNDIPLDPRRQNSSSQQSLTHQDTQYHGASAYSSTDIPLQNRPHKPDDMDNDHVHDAEPGYNQAATQKRRKVRFGELGMFKGNKKRIPFVVYVFTVVQLAVFIGELVKNSQVTGSVIMTRPSFNPMIGPSTYVLINMGARFVPCMHNISETVIPKSIPWPCPETTSNDPDDPNNQCTLGELCGFGAPHTNDNPYQWFRFILPIFMHAGIIHIGFNLLLQMTIGREMEQAIGSIRFFLVYISAGIFGFVMGGNYGGTGISSTGASGALFGIIALTLLDLLYSWRERKSPGRELAIILVEIVISFALGLLPGLDNFAHIGGFLMGIALGISVLHSPNSLRTRIGIDTPYTTVTGPNNNAHQEPGFLKNPVGFFKGRKPLWWAWWLIRAGALLIVIIGFILLLQNFYVHHNTCDWCRYLSCIPINDWCEIGNLQVQNSTSKRDLFATGLQSIAPLYA